MNAGVNWKPENEFPGLYCYVHILDSARKDALQNSFSLNSEKNMYGYGQMFDRSIVCYYIHQAFLNTFVTV